MIPRARSRMGHMSEEHFVHGPIPLKLTLIKNDFLTILCDSHELSAYFKPERMSDAR